MLNPALSKLIYFLAALDGEERGKFKEFLHSPIFNQRAEPRLLYEHILKHCLRPIPQELDDTTACSDVWPGQPQDIPKLQKVKTVLMGLLLEFMEFSTWQQNGSGNGGWLLKRLNTMDEQRYFEQYYRKARKELEESPTLQLSTYGDAFALEQEYFLFRQKHGLRAADNHLEETIAALDRHLLAHLLKYAYIHANQSRIVGAPSLPAWMAGSLQGITHDHVRGEPLLEIFFLLYHTLGEQTTLEDLQQLKALVLAHAPQCEPYEAYDVYTAAINNFNRHSKRSGDIVLEEVFLLYTSLVDAHARKMGMGLAADHFKNIVSIGMRLGKAQWIAELLREAPQLVRSNGVEVQSALEFSRGVYHFFLKEYPQAARHFNAVLAETKDIFFQSDSRAYLLMCFYENGDSLGMESMAHSFRMFLSRSDRVSEQYKSAYLSFIGVFRRVLATPPNDQFRLQNLKAEIDALQFSGGKAWLLRKVSDISEGT